MVVSYSPLLFAILGVRNRDKMKGSTRTAEIGQGKNQGQVRKLRTEKGEEMGFRQRAFESTDLKKKKH